MPGPSSCLGQQDDILLLWAAEKNEGWTDEDRSIKKPSPPKKTRPHKQRGNFSSLRTVEATLCESIASCVRSLCWGPLAPLLHGCLSLSLSAHKHRKASSSLFPSAQNPKKLLLHMSSCREKERASFPFFGFFSLKPDHGCCGYRKQFTGETSAGGNPWLKN